MHPLSLTARPAIFISVAVGLILAAFVGLSSGLLGVFAQSGGDSDYTWTDSNAPAPTTEFNWVDATGGTLSSFEDEDDDWQTVDLPFTFTFYGQDYSQVDISTNGFISFDIGSDCNSNYNEGEDDIALEIPIASCGGDGEWGGNPLIAPWFDDLDAGECGDIYHQTQGTAPDRVFVVEYHDICHNDCDSCAVGEGITFEVILYEGTNDIAFQYMDTLFSNANVDLAKNNRGGTATVGLSASAQRGLQYAANQAVLTDELAILFSPVPGPTPPPPAIQGDADCDDDSDAADALKILQKTAGLPYTQNEPCTPIGDPIE